MLDHESFFAQIGREIITFLTDISERRRQPFRFCFQIDLEFERDGSDGTPQIIYVPMRQEMIFVPVSEYIEEAMLSAISKLLEKIYLFTKVVNGFEILQIFN